MNEHILGAYVDVVNHRPTTYVVRCADHGDTTAVTQYGVGRVTIFQGHNAASDAARFVREHNAVCHAVGADAYDAAADAECIAAGVMSDAEAESPAEWLRRMTGRFGHCAQ